jgi:sarcosine oxidase
VLDDYAPGRFPVWVWHDRRRCYGFPAFGEQSVKTSEDFGGRETTAQTRSFEPDPAALERLSRRIRTLLPGLGDPLLTKTCLYTLTPDRDFVIAHCPVTRTCWSPLAMATHSSSPRCSAES